VSHTTSSHIGEPSAFAMPAGVRKIPTAITSPITSAVAVRTPICLLNPFKLVSLRSRRISALSALNGNSTQRTQRYAEYRREDL
jgi:hypothetical protein